MIDKILFLYYAQLIKNSVNIESVLSVTPDDYTKTSGINSFYYRGGVEDNYVNFAGICWRIVRIEGDGSTKLILEDQNQACSDSIDGNWGIPTTGGSTYTGNFGYTEYLSNELTASDGTQNSGTRYIMDYLNGQTNSDKSMATAFKNFQNMFTKIELSKLKSGNWCFNDIGYETTSSSLSILNETQKLDYIIKGNKMFFYDSYSRLALTNEFLRQSTLKCNGIIMKDWNDTDKTPMYVGTLTADEIVYAGGKLVI